VLLANAVKIDKAYTRRLSDAIDHAEFEKEEDRTLRWLLGPL
jgi:hypothetical protein